MSLLSQIPGAFINQHSRYESVTLIDEAFEAFEVIDGLLPADDPVQGYLQNPGVDSSRFGHRPFDDPVQGYLQKPDERRIVTKR